MNCPKCKSTKHRIPESRRTDSHVWRVRVCNSCHHPWVTQEISTDLTRFPKEVNQYKDSRRAEVSPETSKKKSFDTSSLKEFKW